MPCGYAYVHGLSVGDVTEWSLKDRRLPGDKGFVSVFVVSDAEHGQGSRRPEIIARGSGIDDDALVAVLPVAEALSSAEAPGGAVAKVGDPG